MLFLKRNALLFLCIFVGLFFILFNLLEFSMVNKIGTDAVSWFLPAKAIINDMGVPYKDYWDTKPNGLILLSTIWLSTFGESLNSFRFLHIILISTCVFGMLRIFYLTFPQKIFSLFYCLSIIVFLSPRIQTQPLLIELFGLSFSVIALNILLTKNFKSYIKSYWATFLLILSGQMKESYAPMLLAIVPYIIHIATTNKALLKKTLLYSIYGIFTYLIIITLFIWRNHNFTYYSQVFSYISQHTSSSKILQAIEFPKKTFIYFQYSITFFLSLISIFYLYSMYKTKEIKILIKQGKITTFNLLLNLRFENYIYSTLILYSIGAWIGFIAQNKFGSHYDVQMVFPIMFLILIPLYLVKNNLEKYYATLTPSKFKRFAFSCLLVSLILLLIFPKKDYFVEYKYHEINRENISYKFSGAYQANFNLENKIISNTTSNDCIVNVYGWGVGTTYFYANRKPCSRFFLVNLLPKDYESEYKQSLVANPPAAIVYTLSGADLDVTRFEKEVFNYTKVLENCYLKDSEQEKLYFPKLEGEELTDCIISNS